MAAPDPIHDRHEPPRDGLEQPHPLTPRPGDDRIVTIPNALTLGRLLLLPVFVWLLFVQEERMQAAIFLAAISSTDWFDGYIARHFDQGSRFGKLFDPTADRILFVVAITSIIIDGSAPRWFAIVVLVREIVVSTITVTLVAMGCPPVDVTWWGKAGTFALMTAFPLFLAGADTGLSESTADAITTAAWLVGIPGLVLSFYAAVRYVPLWRESLREGRILKQARAT